MATLLTSLFFLILVSLSAGLSLGLVLIIFAPILEAAPGALGRHLCTISPPASIP